MNNSKTKQPNHHVSPEPGAVHTSGTTQHPA